MKILLTSLLFAPSVGGIETVSMILAKEFVAAGHAVKVVTNTPGDSLPGLDFEVFRQPSFPQLFRMAQWCDIYFQSNISLPLALPLFFVRRPWVIVHHTWIPKPQWLGGWNHRLKRLLLHGAHSISISKAIAESLPVKSQLIPNPYDNKTFFTQPQTQRSKPLVAVGRLVSDKGFDVLFHALAQLRKLGHTPELSLIGDGPERENLGQLAASLGLTGQISFLGPRTGAALAEQLRAHEIMVIPSRWREPFGVVALEGIACGCVAVGSKEGGLADAIGPCGLTFPNGDSGALTQALAQLLDQPELIQKFRQQAPEHLKKHQPEAVAKNYLEFFQSISQSSAHTG